MGRKSTLNPTLGPIVCDWVEEYLVHGPGDVQGQPIELDAEFRAFVYRACEVYPRDHELAGRRVYRRTFLSRPKGRAKSELAGMLACAELLAPVRFDGWDSDGDPVGRPVTSPEVLCVATEEDQAGITYGNVSFMLANGEAADSYPVDVGLTRTFLDGGGVIEPITAAATSKDGGKSTFIVCDETHLWTDPRLKRLHAVLTRNITKRRIANGWLLETSTMYAPGEGSIAEETHKAAGAASFLFDHRQAPMDLDLGDDGALRDALVRVYGPAAAWTNIDGIIADEFRNPTKRESDNRRYWLNQPVRTEDTWLVPGAWDACADLAREIDEGDEVVVGFDGSYNRDSTAIVACTVGPDPHLEMVAVWERGPDDPADWIVPAIEVMETIRATCAVWRVREIAADPYLWRSDLEALRDEGLPIVEFKQSGPAMIAACQRVFELVMSGAISHDGDVDIARHVANAVTKTDARGTRITKASKSSTQHVDLAVAAVMAVDRAATYKPRRRPRATTEVAA
jgi:phage terminase large subunit-like protein